MVVNKKYYVVYCDYTDAPFILDGFTAQVYTNKFAVFFPPDVSGQKNEWRLVELSGYEALMRLMNIYGFEKFIIDKETVETQPLPYKQKIQLNNTAPKLWLKRIKSIQIADEELYDNALEELKGSELLLAVKDEEDLKNSAQAVENEGYPSFLALHNDKFDFVPAFTNMLEFFNFRNGFSGNTLKVVKYRYTRLPKNILERNLWINPASKNSWLILEKDRQELEK